MAYASEGARRDALYRELNLSDLHIPYHDPFAWQLTLNIVKRVLPTGINLLGDMMDFYRLSVFDKDPSRFEDGGLQNELDQWYRMARELKAAAPTNCRFRYLKGNHEDRLRRYLMRNPELHGLRVLELEALMRVDDLGIEYCEDEIEIAKGTLIGKHGNVVRKDSAYSAKGELEKERYAISTISGHTHRLGTHYVTTRLGVVKANENGCLCMLNPEFVKNPNWQQGFTMTTHWGEDLFHTEDIPFLNYGERLKAVVLGDVVTL
jgi:UDP-2,3-diacylglucosamine pyrophosphatase LpxH